MDFSKLKNRLLIVFCIFVVIFPFWCVRGLCADVEEVSGESITGITLSAGSNFFTANSSSSIVCFEIEKGYRYTITNNSSINRGIVFSSERPAVNVTYDYIMALPSNDTYSFIVSNDTYFYISGASANYIMTREKVTSMDVTVSDLVDNVGLSNLWGVFNSGINYIVVVVLFAFGFFIIVALIKKLRKGKGGI